MQAQLMSRKEEILRAASNLFLEDGYHRTSLAKIASIVGILKGSLYHYIGSKDELLFDVILETISAAEAHLSSVLSESLEPCDSRCILEGHIRYLAWHYSGATFLMREAAQLPRFRREVIKKRVEHFEESLAEVIRQAQDRQQVAGGDATTIARMILSACSWAGWNKAEFQTRTEIGECLAKLLQGAAPLPMPRASRDADFRPATPIARKAAVAVIG
jgi:AcrR family transcriptional regulator